ncbi:preprotein translocase subunit YajC [Clostridium tarantellae]|uniref:Preprotein translocase subunit YajC n=1 Tax=Clostridium tarantellae TaxID=39493 RepID=A0A6I1MQ83_9CLOT|nr:preprotein translocase subunit YajC [Clostridium tarantellae]MPQ43031.1 preprotein translocase subunit YajC [Clostridium tarantellae]
MNMLITILPFIAMMGVFYLLLIVPEKKRKKKYDEMLTELKINDKVLTRGGIVGRIIKITEENIVIETSADRTKIELTKQGISSKID